MRLPLAVMLAALLAFLPSSPRAETPGARAHHALVFDETRQQVLLSGGSTPKDGGQRFEIYDDLWAFDGAQWRRLGAAGQAVASHRMAFDSANKQVVAVGGYDGRAIALHRRLLGDRFVEIDSAPPVAAEPGLTFERKRGALLLFGGSTGPGELLGQTWVFRDTQWTRLHIPGPGARQAAMLLYLPSRGLSYLFGGMGPGRPPTTLGDLWQFDGTSWREQKPRHAPGARHSSGVTYDTRRKRIILFGGMSETGFLGDTWAFDGDAWTQLSAPGPSPRAMGYLAYDPQRDRVVLFGGRKGWPDGDLNDTWEFDGKRWEQVDLPAEERRGPAKLRNPNSRIGHR